MLCVLVEVALLSRAYLCYERLSELSKFVSVGSDCVTSVL